MNIIEKCNYLEVDIKCQMHQIILEKNPQTVESIVGITNAFKCPGENRCKELCKNMGVVFECKK